MKSIVIQCLTGTVCAALLGTLHGPAVAAPTVDNNLGTWVDSYDDSNGIAPAATVIGGLPGQAGVFRDPFAQAVALVPDQPSGSWFTSEIAPASFSSWGAVYLDYVAGANGDVQVEVWDVSSGGAAATKLLGPVNPGPSDNPSYDGKISISALPNAERLRIRVIMTDNTVDPTVSEIAVTWDPLSVLQASLELQPTATRASGDVIQLRMPVSVSFVNATDYVAYATFLDTDDDRYSQNPTLTFQSATFGGQYTASGTNVGGVNVPARSVYWAATTQEAGKTYAYSASFRSPNGLVKGLAFNFRGKVHASNADTVQTSQQTARIDAKPRTVLYKNASGTFVFGGEHYARADDEITLIVSPTNWWAQAIPYGAQTYFQPVVYDTFQDFIAQGAIANSGAVSNASHGGIITAGGTTVRGVAVPANSVYWLLDDMPPGQRLNLSYDIQLDASDGTVINDHCGSVAPPNEPEAWFATPQETVTGVNQCATGECARRHACLPIHIGLDDSPGFAFGKGDEINGSLAIRTAYDDNPGRFITWGQPANFKLSVGNSSLARLEQVVVYDYVDPTWTLLSASVPTINVGGTPTEIGRVWYWKQTGDNGGAPPSLYDAGNVDLPNWQDTPTATPTWIAYEIDALRSSYCGGPSSPNGIDNCSGDEPISAVVDFSVLPTPGNECDEDTIENTGYVRVYKAFDLAGENVLSGQPPIMGQDDEWIDVKPLVPDLTTSFGTNSGAVTPGQSTTHTIVVQNRNAQNNPIDTATNVTAVITRPVVKANGQSYRLFDIALDSDGGAVTRDEVAGKITVTWPSILAKQKKTVTVTYATPTGIEQSQTVTTNVAIAADDDCGIPTALVTVQSPVASEPDLKIEKDLDFRVADEGVPVTYTLRYRNIGTAPAKKTWVVDYIDPRTEVLRAKVEVGEVWFSDHIPPFNLGNPLIDGLPAGFGSGFQFSDAVVRAHFKPGIDEGGGWFIKNDAVVPGPARWVAFLVDEEILDASPPSGPPTTSFLFPTGLIRHAYIEVEVPDDGDHFGELVVNEPAIVAESLEQAIGERVHFIISDEPGVDLSKSCPEVVYVGEPVVYHLHWRNDTTNLDVNTTVSDTFPDNFVFDSYSIWTRPDADSNYTETTEGWPAPEVDGSEYTWLFGFAASKAEVDIMISGHFEGVTSGESRTNEVLVTSSNEDGLELSFFDDCTTLIQNTELSISKQASNTEPLSARTPPSPLSKVTYIFTVTNHSPRDAEGVEVNDALPSATVPPSISNPISFDTGSLKMLTPGWQITDGSVGDYSFSFVPQLVGDCEPEPCYEAGVIPGGLTPTTFRFSIDADVGDVGPGKSMTNTVEITNEIGEDCDPPPPPADLAEYCEDKGNDGNTTIRTPWPDNYVSITATPTVKPGEIATWTIQYGNQNLEDANNTVVFFQMPEGPTLDNATDFTFTGLGLPETVTPYFSSDPIGTNTFDYNNPEGGTWDSNAANVSVVNLIAFVVTHCESDCETGIIEGLQGPFTITVKAEARDPSDDSLAGLGNEYLGCAEITMFDPNIEDDNESDNGEFCAPTVTPGVGLGVAAACDPSGGFPGIAPGGVTTFTFEFENDGTTPDFGVQLAVDLDPRLEWMDDDAGVVQLFDANGDAVNPIGLGGFRVAAAPNWERDTDTSLDGMPADVLLSLGPNPTNSMFGLAPGDHGTITVTARVKGDVPDSSDLVNMVYGKVNGRPGIDQPEDPDGGNNLADCGFTVYRADVFVIKSIVNASDPEKGYADGGDTLTMVVEYGNAGHFAASDVVMTDSLVEGLMLVAGSARDVPLGAIAEYADNTGTWGYNPTSPYDPNVRGVRVRYLDGYDMPAPANEVFNQDTYEDFLDYENDNNATLDANVTAGFAGTFADPVLDAVELGGGPDDGCRDVNVCISDGIYQDGLYDRADISLAISSGQCSSGWYLPEGECCQHCCPSGEEIDHVWASYFKCVEAGQDGCVEPDSDALIPDGCEDKVGKFCGGTKYPQPDNCEYFGNGYYGPTGQCNRACCPPAETAQEWVRSEWFYECMDRQCSALSEWCEKCGGAAIGDDTAFCGFQCLPGDGGFDATCGPMPDDACSIKDPPAECLGAQSATSGTYTSAVIPDADQGNVLEWGLFVVEATFNPNNPEQMWVEVTYDKDKEPLTFPLDYLEPDVETTSCMDDGDERHCTYTFDLRGLIDSSMYPNLQVRAYLEGTGSQCMIDIAEGDFEFWGMPTGINEPGVVIGAQLQNYNNITAWAWNIDDGIFDLNSTLPFNDRWVEDGYTDFAWGWSVPTDIDNNGVIVGFASPLPLAASADANGTQLYLPEECFSAGATNEVAQIDLPETAAGDANVTMAHHTQLVYMDEGMPDFNGRLFAFDEFTLYLANDPQSLAGAHLAYPVVKLGYTDGSATDTSFETEFDTVLLNGDSNVTIDTLDGVAYTVTFRNVNEAFIYQPERGDLLIDITYLGVYDSAHQPVIDAVGALVYPLLQHSDTDTNSYILTNADTAASDGTLVSGGAAGFLDGWYVELVNTHPPIAWTPDGGGGYTAQCLPPPPFGHIDCHSRIGCWLPEYTFAGDFGALGGPPANSNVFINDSGVIASSYSANRDLSATYPRRTMGTATVWCDEGEGRGYEAQPVLIDGDLPPPAIITGLDDNNTLIGVFLAQKEPFYSAAVARPTGPPTVGNCPPGFTAYPLHAPAMEAISAAGLVIKPFASVPLDIAPDGSIIGQVLFRNGPPTSAEGPSLFAAILIQWTWNGQGYDATVIGAGGDPTRLDDYHGYLDVPPGITEDDHFGEFLATELRPFLFGTTRAAVGDGAFAFMKHRLPTEGGYDANHTLEAYVTDLDVGSHVTAIPSGELACDLAGRTGSCDLVTGAASGTVLGTALSYDTAPDAVVPHRLDAWIRRNGEVTKLGRIPGLIDYNGKGQALPFYVPTHGTTSGPVAGYATWAKTDDLRTFYWYPCSAETPRLDRWTVTYQTDKNPNWSFDVVLDDICTTSIDNSVDITTSTPEITTENNSSSASISVNTADVATSIELTNVVAAPNESITGFAHVENLGPGLATEIEFDLGFPVDCGYAYLLPVDSDPGDGFEPIISSISVTDFFGALTYTYGIDQLLPGTGVDIEFHCLNMVDEPGYELSASIAARSPTIDCNADNDASSESIIVGSFPNLWVGVSGPTSTTVGMDTPYILTFGNNGNQDTNGTIEVSIPVGALATVDCDEVEAPIGPAAIDANCTVCDDNATVTEGPDNTLIFAPAHPTDGAFFAELACEVDLTLSWDDCGSADDEAVVLAEAIPDGADANVADNQAAATTQVLAPLGDLKLWVDRSESQVELGKEILYTIHYANLGTGAAIGTELVVVIPDGVEIQAVIPPADHDVNSFALAVGRGTSTRSLLPGDSGAITIRALVTAEQPGPAGFVSLGAQSGACGVTVPIDPPAVVPNNDGLHVLVSPSQGSGCGEDEDTITWTVTVTNTSGSARGDVPITAVVPAGLVYVPGSLEPNGNDSQAPALTWTATIPARGVLNFAFETQVEATGPTVAVVQATAGGVAAAGTLPINCEDRVVVSKSWGLSCGSAGDTVDVDITVTNLTKSVVSGTLYDTFQIGTSPSPSLDGTRTAIFEITLVPGESTERSFSISISSNSGLLYADPLFNRAVFKSAQSVEAASNQVAGGIADCGTPTHCFDYACDAFTGCFEIPNSNPGPELCGNNRDDDCDGVIDDGFEHLGEACDAQLEGGTLLTDTDLCLNDTLVCSDDLLSTECESVVFAVELCNGLDDDCDGVEDETFLVEPFNLGQPCDGGDDDQCEDGEYVCAGFNTTTCNDDAASVSEMCNGIDDDCDDEIDEDWPELGEACDGTNDADFCKRGTIECNIDHTGSVCLEEDLGVTEVCNGVDDTCWCDRPGAAEDCVAPPSEIDEGFGIGEPCTTDDLGVCQTEGIIACSTTTTTFCEAIVPVSPSQEVCDGLDNDCDGDIDEAPLEGSVCVDLETEILTGPPPITSSTTATFTYINPLADPVESHTTFECRLDDEDWVVCNHDGPNPSLTYTNLTPGQHTLHVRATRGDGSFDPTPDTWTWVIDGTIPETTILSSPPDPSTDPGGTFIFGSPTPNPDHYMCILDPTPESLDEETGCPDNDDPQYEVCSETYVFSDLEDGEHTMCVYVVDTKGDEDPTPASYTWTIYTEPPETEITEGPPQMVPEGSDATFVYVDPNNPDTITFECSLDGEDWVRCDGTVVGDGGTINYPPEDLPPGEHTFKVRTCDFTLPPSIQCDPTPATWTWEVQPFCPNERELTLTCSDSATVEAEADRCDWSGILEAIARDNCSDEVTVTVDDTYPVGVSPVLFTASNDIGQTAECTTELTVLDVTPPTVECGAPVGQLPVVIRALAADACGPTITIDALACSRIASGASTPIDLADCPVTVTGDTVEVSERLTDGMLEVVYDVTAVDPSGNEGTITCSWTFEPALPDQDQDGIIDADDNCMVTPNGNQSDRDEDGFGDACDVCPDVSNPDQLDSNDDGVGDVCSDIDRDTVIDLEDNCVTDPNTDQLDSDLDGIGDSCDESPFDQLKAHGDGSCSGGGGVAGGLVGLALALILVARRRRQRSG